MYAFSPHYIDDLDRTGEYYLTRSTCMLIAQQHKDSSYQHVHREFNRREMLNTA